MVDSQLSLSQVLPQVRGNVVTTKRVVKGFTSKLVVSAHFMKFSVTDPSDFMDVTERSEPNLPPYVHFNFGLDLPPNEAKCNTSTLFTVIVRMKVNNVPKCDV